MYATKNNTNQLMSANYPLGKNLGLREMFQRDLYFISIILIFYNKKIFTYVYIIFIIKTK